MPIRKDAVTLKVVGVDVVVVVAEDVVDNVANHKQMLIPNQNLNKM